MIPQNHAEEVTSNEWLHYILSERDFKKQFLKKQIQFNIINAFSLKTTSFCKTGYWNISTLGRHLINISTLGRHLINVSTLCRHLINNILIEIYWRQDLTTRQREEKKISNKGKNYSLYFLPYLCLYNSMMFFFKGILLT